MHSRTFLSCLSCLCFVCQHCAEQGRFLLCNPCFLYVLTARNEGSTRVHPQCKVECIKTWNLSDGGSGGWVLFRHLPHRTLRNSEGPHINQRFSCGRLHSWIMLLYKLAITIPLAPGDRHRFNDNHPRFKRQLSVFRAAKYLPLSASKDSVAGRTGRRYTAIPRW